MLRALLKPSGLGPSNLLQRLVRGYAAEPTASIDSGYVSQVRGVWQAAQGLLVGLSSETIVKSLIAHGRR